MLSTERPGEACAEFRVGVRSVPYLADHGFQDMVVLPGSFYVEMARQVDRELAQRVPGLVRNLTFRNPIILAAEDTVVRVDVRDRGGGRVEYTFCESGTGDGRVRTAVPQYAARLEIDRNVSATGEAGTDAPSIEAFQRAVRCRDRRATLLRSAASKRQLLRPSFQKVTAIWRAGRRSLGKLYVSRREAGTWLATERARFHDPTVLASFSIEKGKTFVCDRLSGSAHGRRFARYLWAHAVLRQRVTAMREPCRRHSGLRPVGKQHAELSGVEFAFLDHVDAAGEATATSLVIAANFTAEPIEDSLKFWGDHFGAPVRLEFAPYDQVFQQLLIPKARRARTGTVSTSSCCGWRSGPHGPA